MSFLQQDYKVPTEPGNYMKFEDGENRFRILGEPIMGWLDWDDQQKCYRTKTREEQPESSRSKKADAKIKHFWAIPIFNTKINKIQILEITQTSVQKQIQTLILDPEWGEPYDYDIAVYKIKSGERVSYTTQPKPKKDIDPKVKEQYKKMNINLNALYLGEDPFNSFQNEMKGATP